ncbi:ABC transporter ATP-binding protein [Candidatus Hydrogenosomobacter endosymbioticus]|uniref:ABC transporter ATP-binding protein n=2 Tax=Candidatus Hydrogenosomobacter endosymbioticus TaxID=2558174 RepID=A0ABM7V9V6_9PROT|nr:ABC transporter ATP-binding protein [Candidatus Hydrogenosomobacter endosymbioticus]
MIVSAATTAALARYLKPIFDDIFSSHKSDMLLLISSGLFLTFLARGLAAYGESVCLDYVGQKMVISIQKMLFDHIVCLPISIFHKTPAGKTVSVLMNDTFLLKNSVTQSVIGICKDSLTVAGLVCLMLYEDALLSFIAFFGLPLIAIPILKCGKKMRSVSSQAQEATADMCTFFQQALGGICIVKAYGAERYESNLFIDKAQALFKKTFSATKVKSIIHPVMEVIGGVAIVGVIMYGGSSVMSGHKTTGDFVSFITALLLMYRPLKNIVQLNNQIQEGMGAADRIFDIMNEKQEQNTMSTCNTSFSSNNSCDQDYNAKEFSLNNCISLSDVSFKYPSSHKNLFSGLSCEFQNGKKFALVGPSGSGKTTLFYLLLRFYSESSGAIYIDKTNINDISLGSLRRNISLVSQNTTLFDDTIFNNIAYGMKDASIDEVMHAAELASASGFIEKLDQKYETFVGENGVKLSGGERQRISIARAFLRNSPILLLDEATSSLDRISEQEVQKSFFDLMESRTAIVIAHRISTIEHMDRIFVMQHGSITASGTHSDLLANDPLYKSLSIGRCIK